MAFISSGTTILDNGAFSVGLGGLVLLSEQTASASASISFTSGIDSTYDIYKFEFIDIHPRTTNAFFQFNLSTDSGSNYNVTKTSTAFYTSLYEYDAYGAVAYTAYQGALAQSTSFQNLAVNAGTGNGADNNLAGSMFLYNPASTVYVKHFISVTNEYHNNEATWQSFVSGYGNTTSATNAIRFQMSTGNFDGTIKLYGIKGS